MCVCVCVRVFAFLLFTTYDLRSRLPENTSVDSAKADRSNNGITACSTPSSNPKHLRVPKKNGKHTHTCARKTFLFFHVEWVMWLMDRTWYGNQKQEMRNTRQALDADGVCACGGRGGGGEDWVCDSYTLVKFPNNLSEQPGPIKYKQTQTQSNKTILQVCVLPSPSPPPSSRAHLTDATVRARAA